MTNTDQVTRQHLNERPHPAVALTELTHRGDELTIGIEGQLTYQASQPLQERLGRLLDQHTPARLVLDCTQLTFLDSQGLSTLLALHRRCKESGARLAVRNPNAHLVRLLAVTQVNRFLEIE